MSLLLRIAALLALLAPGARAHEVFELSLVEGWARATTEHGVHWLTAASPAISVDGGAYLELGGGCVLEVVDAGRGSLLLHGTTSAELRRRTDGTSELLVRRYDRLEVHALRGRLDVVLPAGQRLSLRHGVTHLVGAPDGRSRVEHLLGEPLELDLGGWYTFELPVGTRRELPGRLTPEAAPRRREDFRAVLPARAPEPAARLAPAAAVAPAGAGRPGVLASSLRRGALDGYRTLQRQWSTLASGRSQEPW